MRFLLGERECVRVVSLYRIRPVTSLFVTVAFPNVLENGVGLELRPGAFLARTTSFSVPMNSNCALLVLDILALKVS